jgi:hypothetical protein
MEFPQKKYYKVDVDIFTGKKEKKNSRQKFSTLTFSQTKQKLKNWDHIISFFMLVLD